MTINIGCPGGHIPVETLEDVHRFLDETNGMHDAYLLSADYRTHVRAITIPSCAPPWARAWFSAIR